MCVCFLQRLQAKVLKLVDISYGGENGFNQAIELSAEVLSNVKFIQEKKLIGESVCWTSEQVFLGISSEGKIKQTFVLEIFPMVVPFYRAVLRWDQSGYGEVLFWCGGHTQSPGDGSSGDPHSLRELRHHALHSSCAWGREQRSREWYTNHKYLPTLRKNDKGNNYYVLMWSSSCLCSWFSDEKTLYLTPEQEKDKSHFTDKEVSATKKEKIPVI